MRKHISGDNKKQQFIALQKNIYVYIYTCFIIWVDFFYKICIYIHILMSTGTCGKYNVKELDNAMQNQKARKHK